MSKVVISNQTFVVLKRFEHGTELSRTEIPVESVREAFEVDVGGVHIWP